MSRLTKAQREFLADCGRLVSVWATATNRTALKLEKLGLINAAKEGIYGRHYVITEAGRAALSNPTGQSE